MKLGGCTEATGVAVWAMAFVGAKGKGLGLSSERASLSGILKDEE